MPGAGLAGTRSDGVGGERMVFAQGGVLASSPKTEEAPLPTSGVSGIGERVVIELSLAEKTFFFFFPFPGNAVVWSDVVLQEEGEAYAMRLWFLEGCPESAKT